MCRGGRGGHQIGITHHSEEHLQVADERQAQDLKYRANIKQMLKFYLGFAITLQT